MLSYVFQRLLVISPHADDEILGCGGLMARVLTEVPGAHVRVIVMGTATVTNSQTGYQVTAAEREQELAEAIRILVDYSSHGSIIDHRILYSGMERQLDRVGMGTIVDDLDKILEDFQPTAVLVCDESFHQDHKITHHAALAATRPFPSNYYPFCGLYECGYLDAWPTDNHVRMPKVYVDISQSLPVKLKAFQAYTSQQRADPKDLRSLPGIEAFAKTRGRESGLLCAEAFFPLRVIL